MFGYLLRSIEYEVNNGNLNPKTFTLSNSMWCSVITMTSVGYGDYFPKTIFGRLIGFSSAYVGVGLESLVVLTAHRMLVLRGFQLS